MNQERFPKIAKETPRSEKEILTEEDVKDLAKGLSTNKEEVGGFADFIAKKFQKMNRRDFLKIAGGAIGTAVGLSIGYKYFEKNIDNLWAEYQREKIGEIEIEYSQELTDLYEKISKMPETKREFKDLKSSLNLVEKLAAYSEGIKISEKKTLSEFAKELSKKENFDSLIFGELHFSECTEEKAAYLLEKMIENNKKVAAICFEGLSFEKPEHTEATKRFNRGELSIKEMSKFVNFGNSLEDPLLNLARKDSIEIVGLEREGYEYYEYEKDYPGYTRFSAISERVGAVTKEKRKDGIVVTYIGKGHVTTDDWEGELRARDVLMEEPPLPSKEEALKNNYTIKEYLEKINLKPTAVLIDDWGVVTKLVDYALSHRFENLSPENQKSFYEKARSEWQKYILSDEEDFVVRYPRGSENAFSMIIPDKIDKIPEIPPILNGYKTIYENKYLAEMLNKGIEIGGFGAGWQEGKEILIPLYEQESTERIRVVKVDKNTGKIIKLYLPEQARERK